MTEFYGPIDDGSLVGQTYLSVSVTEDGADRPLVPGTRIRLNLREDGVLIARAGCNTFSGGIMLDDGVATASSPTTWNFEAQPEPPAST